MTRQRPSVSISPWAALAAGLLVYYSDGKTLFLLVLPIAVHESGHWLCLRLLGCRIRALRWELSGLCIRYTGDPGRLGQAAAALAGPIAGLLYAQIAARFGSTGELSAGISLLLSFFNLIPAFPLDGGRAAEALLSRPSASFISLLSAIIVAGLGLVLFARGEGAALLIAGAILLAAQYRQEISSAMSPD